MAQGIFISYATGDEKQVSELYDSLSKIKNFEAYFAERVHDSGTNLPHEVRKRLERSKAAIILITYNSTNTIWLNQEIGYAAAKNIPMILIVEQGIDPQGFIQGKEYIVFNRADFAQNVTQVIARLKSIPF